MRIRSLALIALVIAPAGYGCGGDDTAETTPSAGSAGTGGSPSTGGSAGKGGAGTGGAAGSGTGGVSGNGGTQTPDGSAGTTGGSSGSSGGGAAGQANDAGDSSVDTGKDSASPDVVVDASDGGTGLVDGSDAGDGAATCFFPANRPVQASLSTGLVAWYCFNDETALGKDCSTNARDLTVGNAVTSSVDGFGRAIVLNAAANSFLERTDPAFTPGTSDWTVSAWFKLRSTSDFGNVIGWYRCGANPECFTPDNASYSLGVDPPFSEAVWQIRDDTKSANVPLASPRFSLAPGCWHLVTSQIVQTAPGASRLYVDGVLVDSAPATFTATGLSSGAVNVPFEIGRTFITGWGTPNNYFSGLVDDVRVYNRALSLAEIQALYAGGM